MLRVDRAGVEHQGEPEGQAGCARGLGLRGSGGRGSLPKFCRSPAWLVQLEPGTFPGRGSSCKETVPLLAFKQGLLAQFLAAGHWMNN